MLSGVYAGVIHALGNSFTYFLSTFLALHHRPWSEEVPDYLKNLTVLPKPIPAVCVLIYICGYISIMVYIGRTYIHTIIELVHNLAKQEHNLLR